MSTLKNIKNIFQFLQNEDGSVQKRTIRSISWVGVTSAIVYSLSFIKGVILARLLFPEVFGLMSICLIVIRGVEIFTETGFGVALIYRRSNFDEEKDTAFTLLVIRGFLISFFIYAIAPFVAKYYKHDDLELIIKIIAFSLIINSFGNINSIRLQIDLNFKKLSYIEQINNLFSFAIVVSLAYYFRNIWALVIGHIVFCLLGVLLSYVFIPGKPRFCLNFVVARKLFSYGKFITGLAIVIFIALEIDNVIIGKILGLSALGYYVIAFTLANLPATHLSKVVSRVLFPAYSELQGNLPALQSAFLTVYKIIAIINIPILAGFIFLAPEIVRIIYGEKWLPAADALRILAIFGCFRSFSVLSGYLFNAIGKPNLTFYLNLIRLIFLLALIFPLTERYGLVGASLAVTAPAFLQYVLENYLVGKAIGVNYYQIIKVLMLPVIYSIGMVAVIILLKSLFFIINTQSFQFSIFGIFLMNFDYNSAPYALRNVEVLLVIITGMLTYFSLSHKVFIYQIRKIRSMVKR